MWAYLTFLGIFLLAGLVLLFLRKIDADVRRSLLGLSWTITTTGALLFFFRYQQIPYLGMDVFRTLLEALAIVWLGLIIRSARKTIPQKKLDEAVRARKEKYLPKAK